MARKGIALPVGSSPSRRYIGADQCTWPRARFQRQTPQPGSASVSSLASAPSSARAVAGARYQSPPASRASTRPVRASRVISRRAALFHSASAASTGWIKASCASVCGTLRTVTMASVPSSSERRSTPASAPKVVSGCCGPRIVSRFPMREPPSGARAWIVPSASAKSALRPSAVAPLDRLSASAPCQFALELSVLSLRLRVVLSAISAS